METIKGYKIDNELESVIKDTQNLFYKRKRSDILKEEVKVMDNGKTRGFEIVSSVEEYTSVILPKRSTEHSAGYDFYAYKDITIPPSYSYKYILDEGRLEKRVVYSCKPSLVKTGIKAYMGEDEVLMLYNRSSNPKKLNLILANGVGVVDSDYYNNPDNEGEIGFMFYNISSDYVTIHRGDKIGQGVFQKYLKADGDEVTTKRVGGYGSTGK